MISQEFHSDTMLASDPIGWQVAADAARHDLGPAQNQRDDPESALKDLEEMLKRHRQNSIRYRSLNKLRPLFDGVKKYTDIISAATSADAHGVASLVWGIFKSIVALAESYLEFFDELGDFIDQSAQSFDRLKIFQNLFEKYCNKATDRLDESLLNVFNEFSKFRGLVEKFFAKRKSRLDRATNVLSDSSEKQRIKICISNIEQCCIIAEKDAELVSVFVGIKLEEHILSHVQSLNDAQPDIFSAIGLLSKDIQQGQDMNQEQINLLENNQVDIKRILSSFNVQVSSLNSLTNKLDHMSVMQQLHTEAANRMEAQLTSFREQQDCQARQLKEEQGRTTIEISKFGRSLEQLQAIQARHATAAHNIETSLRNVENQQNTIYDRQSEQLVAGEKVQQNLNVLVEKSRRVEVHEYLQWLNPFSKGNQVPQEERLEGFLRDKLEDTCDWILNDGEPIVDWMNRFKPGPTAIWLTGDAGFGKTITTSHILHELKEQRATGIAYFFCRRDNPESQQVAAILRAWITQLLQPISSDGIAPATSHFTVPVSRETFLQQQSTPTMSSLCRIARSLFAQQKPTWLVVDGFDECVKPADDYELREFFNLILDSPPHWRILVVSRPDPWFEAYMPEELPKKLVSRVITYADNKRDLDKYIDSCIDDLGQITSTQKRKRKFWADRPELKKQAAILFKNKSQGMFLYIQLLKEKLNEATKPSEAVKFMEQPPENLDQLYKFEIKRLSELGKPVRNELWMALQCIVCAFRPLRIPEIAVAISIEVDTDELDEYDLTPQEDLQEDLHMHAGSFLETKADKDIRFRHASASEFLSTNEGGLSSANFTVGKVSVQGMHAALANKCLTYLCFEHRKPIKVDQDRAGSDARFDELLRNDAFLNYACLSWIHHASEAAQEAESFEKIKDMLNKFFNSLDYVIHWLQMVHFLFVRRVHSSDRTKALVQSILSNMPDRNDQPFGSYLAQEHPTFIEHLGWAPGNRFTRWDRYLTRPPHVLDEWNKYNFKPMRFPELFIASFFDYESRVRELISGGTSVEYQGDLNDTALVWATDGEALEAMKYLINAGADIEIMYGPEGTVREGAKHLFPSIYAMAKQTPLYLALKGPYSGNGRDPISYPAAGLLLDKGSNITIYGSIRGTHCVDLAAWVVAIHNAIDSIGAGDIIVRILRRGEAWKQVFIRTGGPLHLAARAGKPQILKSLLGMHELRGSISTEEHRMTPLHMASCSGNEKAVHLLIEAGADKNRKCALNGYTPLHISVLSDSKTLPTLLEHGADISATDDNGNSFVHLAAISHKALDLARLRKDQGFNLDQTNKCGKTALQEALESNNFDMANQLVEHGADVNRVPNDLQVLFDLPIKKLHPKLLSRRTRRSRRLTYEWTYILCNRKSCEYTLPRKEQQSYDRQPCSNPLTCRHRSLHFQVAARILRFAEIYEKVETIHHEHRVLNEIGTLFMGRPYMVSTPVMGGARQPVHRIELEVRKINGWGPWSFFSARKTDRSTKQTVDFERAFFAYGQYSCIWPRDNLHGMNIDKAKLLRPGDTAVVLARAHYAGWENHHEWARITMWMSVIMDDYTTQKQREDIWGLYAPLVDGRGRVQSMYGHGPGKQRGGLNQIGYDGKPNKILVLRVAGDGVEWIDK